MSMMRPKNNEKEIFSSNPVLNVEEEVTNSEVITDMPIKRGSRVRFIGTKSYSGLDIPQYQNKEYKVKELSDDRVVLAEGANVIAAVNIVDCVKI